MAKMTGVCPRCFKVKTLNQHHVFPKRWGKRHNQTKLFLCEECHKEADALLPQYRKISKQRCFEITHNWLIEKGGEEWRFL